MIKGTKCCNCGDREATMYWHGGQPLCNDCSIEWDKRDWKFREEFKQEILGKKFTNKKEDVKEEGKGNEKSKKINWFE